MRLEKHCMKIKNIQIRKFKKFQMLDVDFQDLDCLVGSNNSGKSTLLQALALFGFCLHQCLSKINGNPITLKNRSISEEDFVVLPVAKGTDLWYERVWQAAGNKHILIELIVTFEYGKTVKTSLDFNFNKFSVKTETENDQVWLEQLRQLKISYLPVFSSFQTREEKRTQLAVRNELGRGNVNVVIRNLLLSLNEQARTDLVAILQRAFPNITKLNIAFDEASMEFISVTYKEEGVKKEFDIFSAGSGFQQFIYLFGFILLERPNIILLDEPDVHLHGQLQKSLLYELQTLTKKQVQILFATHSRDLISAMLPENIIHLHNANAERLHLDYQVFDTLERMGSMENNQLITLQEFKRVLVVENKDDWDYIYFFGKLVLGESKMQQVAKRLAVCYAYGNPVRQDMAKFRKSLQTMFVKSGDTVKMMVLADRDYFPYPQELVDDLQKKELHLDNKTLNHIDWHIWQQNEIENYLLVEHSLFKLVKPKANYQITIDEAILRDKLQMVMDAQKDEIEGRFLKGFEDYSRWFKKNWDTTYCLREAKKRLASDWQQPAHWVDAKKTLSDMKGWLQKEKYGSFSDKSILEMMTIQDIPQEIQVVLHKISAFVGL